MTDCENDRVDAGRRLGHEGRELRDERGDQIPVSECGNHDDAGVRRPDEGPQAHVRDGHLGDSHLGTLGICVLDHHRLSNITALD